MITKTYNNTRLYTVGLFRSNMNDWGDEPIRTLIVRVPKIAETRRQVGLKPTNEQNEEYRQAKNLARRAWKRQGLVVRGDIICVINEPHA